ncbi:hypothetical protein [Desulfosporosinus fructosivorans]
MERRRTQGTICHKYNERMAKFQKPTRLLPNSKESRVCLKSLAVWYNIESNGEKEGMDMEQYSRAVQLWQSYKISSAADLSSRPV